MGRTGCGGRAPGLENGYDPGIREGGGGPVVDSGSESETMAKRKKSSLPPETPPEPEPRQRWWRNGWGMGMAVLTLAPLRPDGGEPESEGVQVWFEPPRHGWIYPHVVFVGQAEFVCRASNVENDFLGDLIRALFGVLDGTGPTAADAFGEPQTFQFRLSRDEMGRIHCDVASFNRFSESSVEEVLFRFSSNGDGVCRTFCFGLRELRRSLTDEAYREGYHFDFPTDALTTLCRRLGGEFEDGA